MSTYIELIEALCANQPTKILDSLQILNSISMEKLDSINLRIAMNFENGLSITEASLSEQILRITFKGESTYNNVTTVNVSTSTIPLN